MTNRVEYDPQPVAAPMKRGRARKRKKYPVGSLRDRLRHGFARHRAWYDWGHPVMSLTGVVRHGDYEIPRGRDLYYYATTRGKFYTTYDYSEARLYMGLDRGWKTFDIQNDGFELICGWYPEDGGHITPASLDRHELRLFRSWDFWECRVRAEWFGLRRWLYYKALHAAVNQRVPFSCGRTPDPGAGGYTHWHCSLKKRHKGPHRFNNYTWAEPSKN